MSGCSTNSHYASPGNAGRFSRQASPFYSQQPRRNHQSTSPNVLDILPTTVKYSNRLTQIRPTASVKLTSLINKFEDLDVSSLPFKISALQLAPLHVPRSSSRLRAGTGALRHNRVSKIFDPRGRRQPGSGDLFADDEFVLVLDAALGNATHRTARSHAKPGQGGTTHGQSTCKTNIRKFGGHDQRLPGNGTRVTQRDEQHEARDKKRGSSIRDRIRFYDGSTAYFVDSDSPRFRISNSTYVIPSIALSTVDKRKAESPFVPLLSLTATLSQNFSDDEGTSSTRAAANPTTELAPKKCTTPITPMKPNHILTSTIRTPYLGSLIPNLFLTQGSSSTNISNVTSARAASEVKSNSKNIDVSTDGSLARRWDMPRNVAIANYGNYESSPKKECVRSDDNRGGYVINIESKEKSEGVKQTRVSPQIETLYRAKNVKRKRNSHGTTLWKDAPFPLDTTLNREPLEEDNVPGGVEHQQKSERRRSQVADMRKLFDGGYFAKATKSTGSIPVTKAAVFTAFTEPKREQDSSAPIIRQSTPVKDSLLPLRKTVDPTTTTENPSRIAISKHGEFSKQILENKNPQEQHDRAIGNKIKLFEGISKGKEKIETQLKQSSGSLSKKLSGPIIGIRRRFFEMIGSKPGESETCKVLNAKDIQDVIDELQETPIEREVGKRKTTVVRTKMVPLLHSPFTSSLGTIKETILLDARSPNVLKEMVVKEVECGLNQPKPLRLAEMKRMMLLCGDSVGGIVERERSGCAHLGKF